MNQYRYNGLDIVEFDNLIWIKNIRDGNIIFSTREGEVCYDFGVKFLNRYNKIKVIHQSILHHLVRKRSF